MPAPDKKNQPRWWTLCVALGLGGGLFGIVSGPISMLTYMAIENYLHGTMFLGLELLISPTLGAVLGAFEGVVVGAVRAYMAARPRRLTLARLMLVVAVSGPTLAFFVAFPPIAVIALINAIFLLPVMIMVKVAVDMRREERRRPGCAIALPTSRSQRGNGIDGVSVRFSDW